MNKIKDLFDPNQVEFSNQQTLSLIGLAGLAALIITVLPPFNLFIDYPFRLFFTIVHELGHGIAAIITGGDFYNFIIHPSGSGLAYTAGGWRLVIIPAGYLGVAVFAALLISMGRSHRWSRIALGVTGAAMMIMSFWFGRPAQPSISAVLSSGLTIIMGVIFGAILVRVALKSAPATIIFLIHLVAIKAGFTAFADIFGLIGLSATLQGVPTDAQSMAELTFIPAVIWAMVWIVMALVFIGWAIKETWLSES